MDGKENQNPEGKVSQEADKEKAISSKVLPVMHILLNIEDGSVGVVMGEKFQAILNDPVQAYGYLKAAEKQLDWYYSKKTSFRDNFLKGVNIANNRQKFREFVGKFKGKKK